MQRKTQGRAGGADGSTYHTIYTDEQLIHVLRGMTAPGLPVGLHTLKAAALTEDKPRVEPIVLAMVRDGELIQLKKDRFIKKEN